MSLTPAQAQQQAAAGFAPWMGEETGNQALPSGDLQPLPLTVEDLEKIGLSDKGLPLEKQTPLEIMYGGRAQQTLELFGYDLFSGKGKSAAGTLPAGMVQDGYILSAGDKLEIILRGQENARKIFEINSRGLLVTDMLSPINAAGQTLGHVRKALQEDAARAHNMQVHVALSAPRQIDVLVIGDVEKPGRKTLTAFHSVLDALHDAGGIKRTGSLRRVKLVRAGKGQFIDLYSVMMQGGGNADIRLQDGDRVIVPPIGPTVAVAGDVKRPAIYEVRRGQTLSALEMLGLAGGVLAPGSNRFIRLSLTSDGREIVEDVSDPSKRQFGDGSILSVAQAQERRSQHITLSGETRDPGAYDITRTQTLSELIPDATIFGDSVYPLLGVVERRDPQTLMTRFIEFSPRQVIGKLFDMPLSEGDTVHLFSMGQIRALGEKISSEPMLHKASLNNKSDTIDNPYLASFLRERAAFVRGAVRQPGAYPVARDTSLDMIVAAAGGPTIEADKNNIEVTTRRKKESKNAVSRMTVSLTGPVAPKTFIGAGDTSFKNKAKSETPANTIYFPAIR